ncbi:hypothetical protein TWF225_009536 [Orbilia oligospora]|nr:hypothetical protein TWF225_009536 [Orbilia oligospora]KAF3247718.1 hypothetical protein TWF217_009522 [Orbilia oligospora]KAF3258738.1 hypothetical protein TWF128_004542 [Orbilia oligospora]
MDSIPKVPKVSKVPKVPCKYPRSAPLLVSLLYTFPAVGPRLNFKKYVLEYSIGYDRIASTWIVFRRLTTPFPIPCAGQPLVENELDRWNHAGFRNHLQESLSKTDRRNKK